MTVVVALEHRFVRVGDVIYSNTMDYERFWKRYLRVFDAVKIFARVRDSCEVPKGYSPASGPDVSFFEVPYYHGPWQYLRVRNGLKRVAAKAVTAGDAFILRVPGTIGTTLWRELRRRGKPYGVEVVADPWDVYAPGAVKAPMRPLIRRITTADLKKQCHSATAAHYVTKYALQKRYPCDGRSFYSSDVTLTKENIVDVGALQSRVERYKNSSGPPIKWKLIHIGTMDTTYKQQDLLIRAFAILRRQGLDAELTLVGDGQFADQYKAIATNEGVSEQVKFLGKLPGGQPIFDVLDSADLFVLPSKTEGLPRVIIEAMARGVACLATDVGGTNELVPPEALLSDSITPEQLAARIAQVLSDQSWLVSQVERGVQVVQEYESSCLQAEREKFYRVLRDEAEKK